MSFKSLWCTMSELLTMNGVSLSLSFSRTRTGKQKLRSEVSFGMAILKNLANSTRLYI